MSSHVVELARKLTYVRDQIRELKLEEDELVQTLAEEMENDALVIDGLGIFERKRANTRRNWDSDGLREELLKRMPDIGRIVLASGQIESEAEAYGRVLSDAARFDWRTTRLKFYGIDSDEWCESTPGRYNIKMVTVR